MLLNSKSNCQIIEVKTLIKYTQEDGLSSFNVRKIIEDKYGFLWVATQDGLNRSDGKTFSQYKKNGDANKRLIGSDIKEIIEDKKRNLLWVMPTDGGLNAIDLATGVVVKTIPALYYNNDDYCTTMILVNDNLWIGSFSGIKIYDINKNKFKNKPIYIEKSTYSAEDLQVDCLSLDNYGNVWACYRGYAWEVYDPENLKKKYTVKISDISFSAQLQKIKVSNIAAQDANTLLFATSDGLKSIHYNSKYFTHIDNQPLKTKYPRREEPITNVFISNNQILLATENKFYIFTNDFRSNKQIISTTQNKYQNDWLSSILCMHETKNNVLWLGCADGLAKINLNPSAIQSYSFDPNSNNSLTHLWGLFANNDSNFYAGSVNGLYQITSANKRFNKIHGESLYKHIFVDNRSLLHISSEKGMFIYDGQSIVPIQNYYPELGPYSSFPINSHIRLNDSLYALGTENENGIILWNPISHVAKNINSTSKPVRIGADIVNSIYQDQRGRLWVISDKTISIISAAFDNAKIITLINPITHQPYNIHMDIGESNESFWLATYGEGIIQLDSTLTIKKIFSKKDGLCDEGVYKVLCANDSLIFITSNNGISVLNTNSLRLKNLYKEDGLQSNSFEEACGFVLNNKIYAGGINGFSVIDPKLLDLNSTPPTVYFTNILFENDVYKTDTTNLLLSEFNIPTGVSNIEIRFSGINYSCPTKTTFAYKIQQIDTNWLLLGTQSFINLIGQAPGTYTLQVKAANEDGVWCEPKTLTLIFEPKWYQTLWFKILLVITGIAIGYSMYRYRLHQLKREEAIRTRIAADLHDDIGSTLTSVRIFTDLGLAKNSTEYFPQIRAGIQEASSSLRDIIWVLDKTNNNAKQLLERIAKFALPLTVARQIDFRLVEEDGLEYIELGTELRRDLYLIAKEFITNSLKYSECQHITLTAKKQNKRLHILLEEDGIGFNPESITRGNGLNNMTSRASKAGYTAKLTSKPGQGSSLELA